MGSLCASYLKSIVEEQFNTLPCVACICCFATCTMKKTVLKVNINCHKCKKDVLKAATKLKGVDAVSVDAEKGTLTVVGDVDPVLVAEKVRKSGKMADIMSVGPPKPPEEKPSEAKPLPSMLPRLPTYCHWLR